MEEETEAQTGVVTCLGPPSRWAGSRLEPPKPAFPTRTVPQWSRPPSRGRVRKWARQGWPLGCAGETVMGSLGLSRPCEGHEWGQPPGTKPAPSLAQNLA